MPTLDKHRSAGMELPHLRHLVFVARTLSLDAKASKTPQAVRSLPSWVAGWVAIA